MKIGFESVGRLPHPDDNVAIAITRLNAGMVIQHANMQFTISNTVLQGHRFAVRQINCGDALYSWGQPFGVANRKIQPGEYVRNQAVLNELARRSVDFTLPTDANFVDEIQPFKFSTFAVNAAPNLVQYPDMSHKTFMGYKRASNRGVGTRNTIVLLGTSALTAGFVRALESYLKPTLGHYPNIDAVVAVAHTEGAHANPNNHALLLRTLSGFMVNPNVAAVLAVDQGNEAVNNAVLRNYMVANHYPLADLLHDFISLTKSFQEDLNTASTIVTGWLDTVNSMTRSIQPISELKIGLQCGGSDAFSGISGNPLAGWVTKEILHYGGAANLAETDELIGAETYVLSKVKDTETAQKFVAFLERFKEWAGWHGHSAHGNPSGGNMYRGLYNIYLKSLGASTKKHPEVRLDFVIDYGERMQLPGFYFMDSPGNDLESVAGQVAAGCNMIFFVTGNGSITNFPFVPTIKIVTTTERYELLRHEMDVNAGAYLDGVPMDELGASTLQLTLDVANGALSAGEKAGHSQVQIWRDWRQSQQVNVQEFVSVVYDGKPLPVKRNIEIPVVHLDLKQTHSGCASDQVGLILPTSLCSGQVARMCVEELNQANQSRPYGVSKFVALVHTEGCGSANGPELMDTLFGYLQHPLVKHALLLEHGCERTHNGYFRELMHQRTIDSRQFGWASVQADGGIQRAIQKMKQWFDLQFQQSAEAKLIETSMEGVRIGLMTHGTVSSEAAFQLAYLAQMIVAGGGTVTLPENDSLLNIPSFTQSVFATVSLHPTVGYAHTIKQSGFHIMATPTKQWNEVLTGIGATGIELVLAHVTRPMPGHPLIPLLQIGSVNASEGDFKGDLDSVMSQTESSWATELLTLIIDTLSHRYSPRLNNTASHQFQITRGLLGVSL